MLTKTTLRLLILAFIGLISWKTISMKHMTTSEAGLFKVTIFYPNGDDKTFNFDYYEKSHMPMLAGFLGSNLKTYEIDKGISGRTPNDKAPYVAIGYFYVTDITEYNKAIGQHRDVILGDIKNYTNVQPVIQISKVEQVVSPSTQP